jgi:hypothetical protein
VEHELRVEGEVVRKTETVRVVLVELAEFLTLKGRWLRPIIVKNMFGVAPINVFQLGVIYKSYRQLLTPIYNVRLLLKLPILDKFRLAIFHTCATQRN